MNILPCPFCGAVPDYENPTSFTQDANPKWASVICGCGVIGPDIRAGYASDFKAWRDRAIEEWNKRSSMTDEPIRKALVELVNEATKFVMMADPRTRGGTNIAVMRIKLAAAREALKGRYETDIRKI